MFPLAIAYPDIDPVLFKIGPLAIRWYALAYVAGIVLGWRYALRLIRYERLWQGGPGRKAPLTAGQLDDLILWLTLGIVLGGRIGYVLFYGLVYFTDHYLENPLRVFAIWEGGMSFHGGLVGVTIALVLFCRGQKLDLHGIGDIVSCATPIGLLFGRLANFINGELYGRPTDVPWAMVFPTDKLGLPRHPSQLYEAATEGLLLFVVLRVLTHHTQALSRPGLISGVFLAVYGCARAFCELFREPENPIGAGVTMGMLLSLPMWIAAAYLIWQAYQTPASAKNAPPVSK